MLLSKVTLGIPYLYIRCSFCVCNSSENRAELSCEMETGKEVQQGMTL